MSARRPGRRRRVALGAVMVLALAADVAVTVVQQGVTRSDPPRTTVSYSNDQVGTLAAGFGGFSFEKSILHDGAFDADTPMAALMSSLGPQVIRFGGNSADSGGRRGAAPGTTGGAYVPDSPTLLKLRAFLDQTHSRVIYTIGLETNTVKAARSEAGTVAKILGPQLAAFAIGNEPDLYGGSAPRKPWNVKAYAAYVPQFVTAVHTAAPGVELVGPDIANYDWLGQLQGKLKGLSGATQHYYTLGCQTKGGKDVLRTDLLNAVTSGSDQTAIGKLVTAARASGLPLRLDEVNSTSCVVDTDHIANTGAAALWAVGYMLSAATAGATGVNFHSALNSCKTFSPVCMTSDTNTLQGLPLLEAMRFVALAGSGTLLHTEVTGNIETLRAWAIRHTDGSVATIVMNFSPDTVQTRVVPAGPATATGVAQLRTQGLSTRTVLLNGVDGSDTPGTAARVNALTGPSTELTSVSIPPMSALLYQTTPA